MFRVSVQKSKKSPYSDCAFRLILNQCNTKDGTQSVNKEPGGRKLEVNKLAGLPRETLIESRLCLNATACLLALYYKAVRDYMPRSHWGVLFFGVTLLCALWTKQQLLITGDVTVRFL